MLNENAWDCLTHILFVFCKNKKKWLFSCLFKKKNPYHWKICLLTTREGGTEPEDWQVAAQVLDLVAEETRVREGRFSCYPDQIIVKLGRDHFILLLWVGKADDTDMQVKIFQNTHTHGCQRCNLLCFKQSTLSASCPSLIWINAALLVLLCEHKTE